MTKRWKSLLLLASLGLVTSAVLFLTRSREPCYQGTPLRKWVHLYATDQFDDPNRDKARHAIQAIGTNALPYLLEAIQYERPTWPHVLVRFAYDNGFDPSLPQRIGASQDESAREASIAFGAIGPQATQAIPTLVAFLNDPTRGNTASHSARALAGIGQPALIPLLDAATNGPQRYRAIIVTVISVMGTNASPAVPMLVADAQSTDLVLAVCAVRTLATMNLNSPEVISALTNALHNPNPKVRSWAAACSTDSHARVESVRSSLQLLLADEDDDVRHNATNALRWIAPEALSNAPPK